MPKRIPHAKQNNATSPTPYPAPKYPLSPSPSHGRYTLRPATNADLPFLWQLKCDTLRPYIEPLFGWDEAEARDYLYRCLDNDLHLVLVDGEPVGMVKLTHPRQDGWLYLAEIGITPSHQNAGLGTCILKDIFALADEHNLSIELQVMVNNPASRLYEKMGFQVSHQKMFRRPSP